MQKFVVKIEEKLIKEILVEAEDEFDAKDVVQEYYYNSDIILDSDSFNDVEFSVIEKRRYGNVSRVEKLEDIVGNYR